MTTTRRRAAGPTRIFVSALAMSALLVSALTGCSLFPDPPEALVRQASRAAAEIGALSGVASATSDVVARDEKDHPGDWVVSIRVHTSTVEGLTTAPGPVLEAVHRIDLRRAYRVNVTLDVPGAAGLAPVWIRGLGEEQPARAAGPDVIEAADLLRRLPLAKRVTFESGTGTVSLTDRAARGPSPLAAAAAALRGIAGLGGGALTAVAVLWPDGDQRESRSIEVTPAAPSEALAAVLDHLASRDDVTWVTGDENRPDLSGTHSSVEPQGSRPTLSIESARPEADAQAVASAGDPAADRGERPRTAFDVHDANRSRSVQGFVGLPVGSAAPGQTWEELLAPAPDPAAMEDQLARYEDDVLGFLQRTVSVASAAGDLQPDVQPGSCVGGGGDAVYGSLLLPLWHDPASTNESVERAFAAIIADWARAGLAPRDRAMGTEFWAPDGSRPASAGIAEASIRGTTDGIRIAVVSLCAE